MSAMKNKNLLNYFNASILNFNFDLNEKDNIKLTYDTDDKNTNWWFSIDEKFSYEILYGLLLKVYLMMIQIYVS